MRNKFSNPADYLAYLQEAHRNQYLSNNPPPKDEFWRITSEEHKKHGMEHLLATPLAGLERAISTAFADVLNALDDTTADQISNRITVGVVENAAPNAFIAKSPDGHLAVVIHSGLCAFLHKYIKLVGAMISPADVTFCNRTGSAPLDRDTAKSYLDEFLHYYSTTGKPSGPMLKLSEAATARSATLLNGAETFVICHEVAHFLNGDLNDDDAFCALPNGIAGTKFVENVNHQIEFKADCLGYDLYCQTLKAQGWPDEPQQLLAPLILAFDGLYQLGGRGSLTHPHPHDRIAQIVAWRHGDQAGRAIRDSLDNPDQFPDAIGGLQAR